MSLSGFSTHASSPTSVPLEIGIMSLPTRHKQGKGVVSPQFHLHPATTIPATKSICRRLIKAEKPMKSTAVLIVSTRLQPGNVVETCRSSFRLALDVGNTAFCLPILPEKVQSIPGTAGQREQPEGGRAASASVLPQVSQPGHGCIAGRNKVVAVSALLAPSATGPTAFQLA